MASEALAVVTDPIANLLHVPAGEFNSAFGNHALALGLQVPAQFIFTGFGRLLAYLVAGVGLLAARAAPGMHLPGRSQQDATDLSAHFLNLVVASGLDPVAMAGVASDVAQVKAGNLQGALVKPASEIQNAIAQLIAQYTAIVGGTAGFARAAVVVAPAPSGFSVPGFIGSGGQPMAGGAQGSIF